MNTALRKHPLPEAATLETALVVDLDGTLTPTDTLVESIIQLIKQSPTSLWKLPFWLLRGRAALKEAVALRSRMAPELLPYRLALLTYLQEERDKGRRIILATAPPVPDYLSGALLNK